jgi:hypothetical protein
MCGATPPLPQYLFTAWCLVKHKDNFTLYPTWFGPSVLQIKILCAVILHACCIIVIFTLITLIIFVVEKAQIMTLQHTLQDIPFPSNPPMNLQFISHFSAYFPCFRRKYMIIIFMCLPLQITFEDETGENSSTHGRDVRCLQNQNFPRKT